MAKKKGKKSPKKDLKRDLKEFSEDCQELLDHHELTADSKFLREFADHIIQLDEDTSLFDNESTRLIHYYLTTPLGAPFVSSKTLLEAALSFNYQEPLHSDLYELVDGMIHFGSQKDNPLIMIFHSIEDHLKKEL